MISPLYNAADWTEIRWVRGRIFFFNLLVLSFLLTVRKSFPWILLIPAVPDAIDSGWHYWPDSISICLQDSEKQQSEKTVQPDSLRKQS